MAKAKSKSLLALKNGFFKENPVLRPGMVIPRWR